MASPNISLPVIDLSSPNREANAKHLVQAMETVGFVYLDNVPGYNIKAEEELLRACKWFFSKPLEEKLKVSPKNWNKDAAGVYRGYMPINLQAKQLREEYQVGETLPEDDPDRNSGNYLYEASPYPEGEGADSFCSLIKSHFTVMSNAGTEFLRLCALGLGLEEHYFDRKFLPKQLSTLGLMHYPTYGDTPQQTITCEEHSDVSFVTLLVTFNFNGLEAQNEHNEWVKVTPRPGSLIVNIGDFLSQKTKKRLRATVHRVRDLGEDRYSVPFFFEPRADSQFEGDKITYGQWSTNNMRRYAYQFGHLPEYSNIPMVG